MTGYDDTEIAAHLQPPLTTVSTDVLGWGEAAAARLLDVIQRPSPHAPVDLPPGTPRRARVDQDPSRRRTDENEGPVRHVAALALGLTAACGGDSGDGDAADSTGPIKVWLSNNPEEIAWGKAMVEAWNAEHPDEEVTAQEIPAGKTSEEVIGAAITAGNAPCLVFNTSPAAVPQFQKQGGLVALDSFDGATDYIEERSGDVAEQYQSPDGQYYQIPWKSEPGDDLLQQGHLQEGRARPREPAAVHVRRLPRHQQEDRRQRCRRRRDLARARPASSSSPGSTSTRCTPPRPAAPQLVEDEEATFDAENGQAVADFWAQMYAEGLAQKEAYNGDAFAEDKSAMAIVGPWAIAVYGEAIDWGVGPGADLGRHRPGGDLHVLRRQEHRALLRLREPEDRVGGAEVRHQRGAGRQAAGD